MYDELLNKYRIIFSSISKFPRPIPEYIQTWVFNTSSFDMSKHDCAKVFLEDEMILFYFVDGFLKETGEYTMFKCIPRPGKLNEFVDVILVDYDSIFECPRSLFMLTSFFILRHMSKKLIPKRDYVRDKDYDLAANPSIVAFRNTIRITDEVYSGGPSLLDSDDLKNFIKTISALRLLGKSFGIVIITDQVKVFTELADIFYTNDNVIQSGGLYKIIEELNKTK